MKQAIKGIGVAMIGFACFFSGCTKEKAPGAKNAAVHKKPTPQATSSTAPKERRATTSETPAVDPEQVSVKETAATGILPAKPNEDKGPIKEKGACDRKRMLAETLKDGVKILAGITLKASTPQSELLASMPLFKGKTVRIDGPIVAICQRAGCWTALRGPNGKVLKLKVKDGAVDFRKLAREGRYAVGEGAFMPVGPHGAQIKIAGAMISKTACE